MLFNKNKYCKLSKKPYGILFKALLVDLVHRLLVAVHFKVPAATRSTGTGTRSMYRYVHRLKGAWCWANALKCMSTYMQLHRGIGAWCLHGRCTRL